MTDEQAAQKVSKLAGEVFPTHPGVAAILFTLAGAINAGPNHVQEIYDVMDVIARAQLERMQRDMERIRREIRDRGGFN